jgi:hypothetical protein
MLLKQETKPLWVTSRQARKLLGVSAATLYRMRKRDEIKHRAMNPQAKSPIWLYWYADLEK